MNIVEKCRETTTGDSHLLKGKGGGQERKGERGLSGLIEGELAKSAFNQKRAEGIMYCRKVSGGSGCSGKKRLMSGTIEKGGGRGQHSATHAIPKILPKQWGRGLLQPHAAKKELVFRCAWGA